MALYRELHFRSVLHLRNHVITCLFMANATQSEHRSVYSIKYDSIFHDS